jgi:hypothetical protein
MRSLAPQISKTLLFFGWQSGLPSKNRVSSSMSSALRGTSNLACHLRASRYTCSGLIEPEVDFLLCPAKWFWLTFGDSDIAELETGSRKPLLERMKIFKIIC